MKLPFPWVAKGVDRFNRVFQTRSASAKLADPQRPHFSMGWPHWNRGFSRTQGSGSPEFRQRVVAHQRGMALPW